jgi:hypothetical protein
MIEDGKPTLIDSNISTDLLLDDPQGKTPGVAGSTFVWASKFRVLGLVLVA